MLTKKPKESEDAYVKRLCAEADTAIKNLKKVTADMKRKGIIGFCKECQGDIYKNKKHKCI